jgi:hypothetical protein
VAFKRVVSYSSSGLESQSSAEKSLELIEEWFRASYKQNEWQVSTSVSQNQYGWKAELVAELSNNDTV